MLNTYCILTHLFEQYGVCRFYEGVCRENGFTQEQEFQKEMAEDYWNRAFAINKEEIDNEQT